VCHGIFLIVFKMEPHERLFD